MADRLNMLRTASARLIRRASSRHDDVAIETQRLLGDEDEGQDERSDDDVSEFADPYEAHHFYPNPFADLPVYDSVWRIRKDIVDAINDPYSYDQLRAPRLNTAVVRPLMDKYYALQDISIVFCLLVNRVQFIKELDFSANFQSVRTTRALLCEILAVRLLRQYDEDTSGADGLLLLTNMVIAGFSPFQNAPEHVAKSSSRSMYWVAQNRGGYEGQITALETAILSESKIFLSSAACQKVVDAIYTGRIIYTPTSWLDILPDHYKHKPISIYNPRKAHALNTYRLSVPRIRTAMEIGQFVILLVLYVFLMTSKRPDHIRWEEYLFMVYTVGWILEQLASVLEHGWAVYSQNLWSFLDVTFSAIFMVYLVIRIHGSIKDDVRISGPALDFLAMGAPFLVPRLAFNIFSENLLFVSLREMMSKFLLLTFLAVWCFAGFFLAMIWLNFNDSENPISAFTTGLWMVWVWFGLDGTGIENSTQFHWVLGPILMISFAILGNTLFLTILVSTLGESYSRIARHANGEIQFRRAVLTFQAVKSDAIFSYPPPFNIAALCVLLPLKFVLSPRWFHKVNIVLVRTLNAPLLLCIGLWERYFLWPSQTSVPRNLAHRFRSWGDFHWLHVHGDIQNVFDSPPPGLLDEPSEARERRRRKSMQVCGPDGQGDNDPPAGSKVSRSRHATPKISNTGTEGGQGLNLRRAKTDVDDNNTNSRLERIEEMLEQIGHSLDDGDDEDG